MDAAWFCLKRHLSVFICSRELTRSGTKENHLYLLVQWTVSLRYLYSFFAIKAALQKSFILARFLPVTTVDFARQHLTSEQWNTLNFDTRVSPVLLIFIVINKAWCYTYCIFIAFRADSASWRCITHCTKVLESSVAVATGCWVICFLCIDWVRHMRTYVRETINQSDFKDWLRMLYTWHW